MLNNIFFPNSDVQQPKKGSLPPIVSLHNIYQRYKTETVFDGLNLEIPDIPGRGQFITLMGKSGCGKSTILKYISNLQKPTSGEILFRGHPREKGMSVPMVFQDYTSMEWKTVLENVMLPLELQKVPKAEAQDRAMAMLKVVGLEDQASKYAKEGLLSGGQLQRVAIARGLVVNPDFLLLDEPFGALDSKTRKDMQIFLRKIFESQEDMTIILVTHSESEAVFLSDRIVILGDKPSKTTNEIDINLGGIRTKEIIGSEQFVSYENMVRKALGLT